MNGETRYARSGELWIAYQVLGEGPVDLLWAPGYMSHLEQNWTWPAYAELLQRLASFSRLINFDRRGTGLSDADQANAIAIQRDGKIVVAGETGDGAFALARYTADGVLDPSFGG